MTKSMHYTVAGEEEYKIPGMELLKRVFPEAKADYMNFCLFSTSGIHGSYRTIEEEEENPGEGVTFLIIMPRMVHMKYGVCFPTSEEDFEFLYKLRDTSRLAASDI